LVRSAFAFACADEEHNAERGPYDRLLDIGCRTLADPMCIVGDGEIDDGHQGKHDSGDAETLGGGFRGSHDVKDWVLVRAPSCVRRKIGAQKRLA
jgi:hypothetical protein